MKFLKMQDYLLALAVILFGGLMYVLQNGLYPRIFYIEWDEEVRLHDGRVLIVHIKRSFERYRRFDRWAGRRVDTEINFDAGPSLGKLHRKFERYDVTLLEEEGGNWYIGLNQTTGIPPRRLIDRRFPVLIIRSDGSEYPASSWSDIPDFPRMNIMPITPGPGGVVQFANKLLPWDAKMDHWSRHPRAAGDNGLIIQRHTTAN